MTSTQVTIRAVEPKGPAVVFEMIEDDTLEGGVGGWETLARPRRSSAAGWVGLPEQTYTLTLMIDGLGDTPERDRSIERECTLVASWGLPVATTVEPPTLAVTGPVLVSPASRWVLQGLSWGSRIRGPQNRRTQQVVTLTLLRYVEPTLVESPARRARERHTT